MDGNQVAFCQPPRALRGISDGEFLRALSWERGARKSLVAAAGDGDAERFFRKLQKRGFGAKTGGRSRGEDETELAALLPAAGSAHTAALTELCNVPVAGKVTGRNVKKLGAWLDAAQDGERLSAVELQLALEVLLRTGRDLPVDLFGRLWRLALTEAVESSAELDESRGSQAADHERLLIQGELPWKAGLLFSEVGGAEILREFGRQQLAEQLEDKTDTDGTPQGDLLRDLALWLAPFVRAIEWGKRLGDELWDDEGTARFQRVVATIVRLCRADGRLPFDSSGGRSAAPLLAAAAKAAGWRKSSTPRRYLQAIGSNGRAPSRTGRMTLPAGDKAKRPVVQSDWARTACLRSGYESDADMLVVAHHADKPLIELTAAGRTLLSGTWDIELAVDDSPLEFADQWTCTCWHSDEDADYLEIQFSFESGIQVERQILLSRTDRFAVLADAVSGAGGGRIEYASRLPVARDFGIESDVPTRECRIERKGLRVRAFPLALPDDRVLSAAGSFGPVDESAEPKQPGCRLELKQIAVGGLYAPLVLDWHKDRRRREADWRRVTVSEAGAIQKSEAASGHRLRIGSHQLLLYRSLRKPAVPRAVLGQHMANETLIGRFDADGDVTPILLVE